ncbi:MAG TPA: thioredoxin domain-containing protein, partial [Blastocatellia bacterium]|nr:thioredoxin domain-containing protein [Blastocatellia bacterium]
MRISKSSFFVALFCSAFFGLLLSAQGAPQEKTDSGKAKSQAQGRQTDKAVSGRKPVIDKVKIESHYRRLNMWPPQIKITVGEPEPSRVRGLYEVGIHADAGHGIVLDEKVFVSEDGQTLLRAEPVQVKSDLFQGNLDKLNTENFPSFGDPNGLVTVVVFSDFQCPFCRTEAIMLREKIPTEFPKNVRVVFADFPLEGLHPWSKPA